MKYNSGVYKAELLLKEGKKKATGDQITKGAVLHKPL